jgi:hypothetical protein
MRFREFVRLHEKIAQPIPPQLLNELLTEIRQKLIQKYPGLQQQMMQNPVYKLPIAKIQKDVGNAMLTALLVLIRSEDWIAPEAGGNDMYKVNYGVAEATPGGQHMGEAKISIYFNSKYPLETMLPNWDRDAKWYIGSGLNHEFGHLGRDTSMPVQNMVASKGIYDRGQPGRGKYRMLGTERDADFTAIYSYFQSLPDKIVPVTRLIKDYFSNAFNQQYAQMMLNKPTYYQWLVSRFNREGFKVDNKGNVYK